MILVVGMGRALGLVCIVGIEYTYTFEGGTTCHINSIALYLLMDKKQLTIVQYLEQLKPINPKTKKVLTRQGILWRIKKNIPLDYVSKIDQIGELWVLTIA